MRFVIVGAGLAGHHAAIRLRVLAPDAEILLIGDEPVPPYDRPPLSKAWLSATAGTPAPLLAPEGRYEALGIDLRPATRIVGLDVARRELSTPQGETPIGFDRLLLATGSRPRRLADELAAPGSVHYLRTLEDASRLRDIMQPAKRLAIIGGGFIGLEVAAAAKTLGCSVTVFEANHRILSRGVPEPVSDWVHALHVRQGVEVQVATSIRSVSRSVSGGVTIDIGGCPMAFDAAIAGIGVVPNVELALSAGLRVGDGIVVDEGGRTSDPAVFACGEVASVPLARGGRRRFEAWKVCVDHAVTVANTMAGQETASTDVPWLWSDQYDANIQVLGTPAPSDAEITIGEPAGNQWALVYLDGRERVTGAVGINSGRTVSMLRKAMQTGGQLPTGLLPAAREHPRVLTA